MTGIVICETSGTVREAFRAIGWDMWSIDILPSDDDSPYHIQMDAQEMDYDGLDLAICHPPCTDLAVSGARWFKEKGRERQEEAIVFFMWCLRRRVKRIAVENPVGIMSTEYRKPDQIIQPYHFGHPERKATCLWLKNLPPLTRTKTMYRREAKVHHASPGPDRWKIRSKTYQGIADAMAHQWGRL